MPWVWPCADKQGTCWFRQAGAQPGAATRFSAAWDAELVPVPTYVPLPNQRLATYIPMAADLDRDGRLEILASPLAQPPRPLLSSEGVVRSGRAPYGLDWDDIQRESVRLVASDSAAWTRLPAVGGREGRRSSGPVVVQVNGELRLVSLSHDASRPDKGYEFEFRGGTDGRLLWAWPAGATTQLCALADLDADGRDELMLTTYGDEHGIRVNGIQDSDSCYCVCLEDDGTEKWRQAFGEHHFIGCLAAVADLDRDSRPEVVVGCYAWMSDFGLLAVLDGGTGAIRDIVRPPDDSPASFSTVGCADTDADGTTEIVATTSGQRGFVLRYRFDGAKLVLLDRQAVGASTDKGTTWNCRLHALADMDGDGQVEALVSAIRQTLICPDPVFYPSKCDSSRLLVLGSGLEPWQELALPEQCQGLAVGDVVPGGCLEMLVVTDRLTLYSASGRSD